MKSIKFISALTLVLALASCDDFELPNPDGQTNVDQVAFQTSNLAFEQGESTVNLKTANQENVFVTVADITKLEDFPEDYTLAVNMEVGNDDSFSKVTTVGTTIDGTAVTVNPDSFNGAIQSSISKKPGVYTDVPVRLVAYAQNGNTSVRLGGADYSYATYHYNVTTLDPETVIEDRYYILTSADGQSWDFSKALELSNTAGSSVSPYDNPQFAQKFNVSESGVYFAILPESAYTAKDMSLGYGCRASSNMAGKLVEFANNAGFIDIAGPVLVTINAETKAYTVGYALDALYAFTTASDAYSLRTNDYINYAGAAVLTTVIRIGQAADSQGILYKEVEGSRVTESEGIFSGELTLGEGSDIKSDIKGKQLYWLEVNLPAMTYNVRALQTLSVIGDGNGWDLETAAQLTASKDKKTWTATGVNIGSMFKINANGNWDFSFGSDAAATTGSNGELVYTIDVASGGGNINVAEPGVYDVEVNVGVYPMTVTLKK
jgi:hypothetical protein